MLLCFTRTMAGHERTADDEKPRPTLPVTLSEFLRDNQSDIIGDWTQRMRSISPARELSDAAIVDHLPAILTRISELVGPQQAATTASLGPWPEVHAVDRLGRGFDLDEMVTEYGLLRRSILDLWESRVGPTLNLQDVRALDSAFDEALRRATVRHAQAREKLLKAVDRISVAALGSTDLDTFLEHLLSATRETTESVDTAVVLLRDGDTLRVRAAVGVAPDLQLALSVSKREGIAGQVAAEGQPLFIRDAATDPRMKNQGIRDAAVRALYTVPLTHEGGVIGVAHIGSLTSYEFSDEDKLLFRTMASRATSVIVQAQLTANLRYSEETFRLAVEAAPAAIVIVDRSGLITLVNTLTERLFGYERRELVGRHAEGLVPERFRQAYGDYRSQFFDDVRQGPTAGGRDLLALRKDGSEVPVEIRLSPLQSHGERFVLAAITDITDRKRAENERAELLLREQSAREDAERASRLKDEFLATLSHELRTPLNAILGYSRMLRSGIMAPQKHPRAVEIIDRNATMLTQIVADVLDVSRIISGKLLLNVQPLDVRGLVTETVETVRPATEAKRLQVNVQIDDDAAVVSADPDRLQQVVWNLISNAVKFTPEGGSIDVGVAQENGHVDIVVSDNGIDVAPEFLPFMFERFRQADGGTTRQHGGLGLGLAIARHLVELHGGTITGMSAGKDQGATFRVRLPTAGVQLEPLVIDRPAFSIDEPAPWRLPESSLEGVHVLAVDDDADALTLVREILEATGARVTTLHSGAEVLERILTLHPDVLVADLGMPVMDGFEMIRRIRQLPDRAVSDIPAIALTAYARSEDRVKALNSGFQMHIHKPLDPPELIAAVAALRAVTRRSADVRVADPGGHAEI